MFSVRAHEHCSRGYRGDTIKASSWKLSLIMKATWYKAPPTLLQTHVPLFCVPALTQSGKSLHGENEEGNRGSKRTGSHPKVLGQNSN